MAKIMINGTLHFYRDKAPYIKAGKSILGALEYDDTKDKLKCHICGQWVSHLGNHLKEHKITARVYKIRFGLRRKTALVSERTRLKQIIAARKRGFFSKVRNTPKFAAKQLKSIKNVHLTRKERVSQELLNSRHHCKAQLLQKLQTITKAVGHTPSRKEIKEYGLSWQSLVHHFGSLNNAAKLAKLAPNKQRPGGKILYSKDQLIAMLQNFKRQSGRFPSASDMSRHIYGLPSQTAFIRNFGSLSNANKTAMRKAS